MTDQYYIHYDNGQYCGKGLNCYNSDTYKSIPVDTEFYEAFNPDMWILQDNKIVPNPNYEQEEKERIKQKQILLLLENINELDKKRIRAICEPSIKDEQTGETWLEYYNKQIQEIRKLINDLEVTNV